VFSFRKPNPSPNRCGSTAYSGCGHSSAVGSMPEYLPSKKSAQCRIDFDMAQTKDIRIPPQTHKDIAIYLSRNSRGVVVLWHSSPFAACSVTTTPGGLSRDLSSSISATLTSMAGLGGIPPAALAGGTVTSEFCSSTDHPRTSCRHTRRGKRASAHATNESSGPRSTIWEKAFNSRVRTLRRK
jgi:hypothetical protein